MLNLYRRITNKKTGQEHFLTENACKVLFNSNQRQANEYIEDRTAFYQNVKGKYVRIDFPKNETNTNTNTNTNEANNNTSTGTSTSNFKVATKPVSTGKPATPTQLEISAQVDTPASNTGSLAKDLLSKKSVIVSGPDDDIDAYTDFSLDEEDLPKQRKTDKLKVK